MKSKSYSERQLIKHRLVILFISFFLQNFFQVEKLIKDNALLATRVVEKDEEIEKLKRGANSNELLERFFGDTVDL